MEKFKFVSALLLFTIASHAVNAQAKFGLQVGFASAPKEPCFGANFEIFASKSFSISPSINFYLPEDYGVWEKNYLEINLDGHVYFVNEKAVRPYMIIGINYLRLKVVVPTYYGDNFAEDEVGANIGLGTTFGKGFLEAKYENTGERRAVVLLGVRF